ncbi:hypothetical protein M427DRAFT_51756 [Gonapodya prolifera JEL478]|uniref:Plectin/eS10 N-terminal domain-containing protein n=1 Tax=Gonapodya prolifera (strain JEL478) TaxID=1344416 RepID=A0A139AVM9_GONPJ|nr:hypothetical protein M427DRAFT_51756 [Gonapodya prolifera JEL478]|eukprot:KXS20792.1 hypothetical protein M427DRAFT_51756 [Gonapodya prolifera JEL478]
MLIPKENRKKIYQYLFQEGVMVAKKDYNAAKHHELDVPNLQVIKALQSLNSRQYVRTQFSWQYYYYFLTNEGVEFLRKELHLPVEIVPKTQYKTKQSVGVRPGGDERGDRPFRGDRPPREDGYRRREGFGRGGPGGKEGAPGEGYKPEFRGGFGRGRGAPAS